MCAAILNVHITEVVKRALKDRVVGQILVVDSEIALHWMNSDTKQLKPWTRNKVIEANRFSEPCDRFHVSSDMNPADIGTRKGASIEDVAPGSEWESGKPWMKLSFNELRQSDILSSVEDIKLRKEQLAEIKKETIGTPIDLCDSGFTVTARCFLAEDRSIALLSEISKRVKERLNFSQYLVDPNKFKFSKFVRVLAIIIKVARILLAGLNRPLTRFLHLIPVDASIHSNHSVFEQIGMTHDTTVLSDEDF